ncbi:GNAT family N-acetyltransferase [Psychrobacter sp. I-STPA6b]|uniref:GNAT family N-acetyltransferase n=1 Tax=Psychrobacter sp. I-STPA6b TaxID=2585718 RepID=UPI001D0C3DAD|nr:GNAT family N-acetyltransferase [Psychrobacter sp. I-STPA6b]
MATISQKLPDTFSIEAYGKTFSLRPVNYPDDMSLLYKWMHAMHVVDQWQLHLPIGQLKAHFEKMLADDHQRLYIISCDDKPIAYTEIYEAYRDRLARYYNAKKSDMGWHILLGSTELAGVGYLKPTGMLVHEFIFQNTKAKKIVAEPDKNIRLYSWLANSFAYKVQRYIKMPEKEAALYFCYKDDLYESRGYKDFYQNSVKKRTKGEKQKKDEKQS